MLLLAAVPQLRHVGAATIIDDRGGSHFSRFQRRFWRLLSLTACLRIRARCWECVSTLANQWTLRYQSTRSSHSFTTRINETCKLQLRLASYRPDGAGAWRRCKMNLLNQRSKPQDVLVAPSKPSVYPCSLFVLPASAACLFVLLYAFFTTSSF